MPTKITFNEDGTCYAEFPENATEQTMNLYWGIVPDSVDDWGNLYVRIGIDNDIIYVFHVIHQEANIAYHATEGEDGIAIDGLSEDCYTGMWFAMKKP